MLPHILIVEDNPGDVFVIREALQSANIDALLHFVKDGEQAVTFFDQADGDDTAPCPVLVLLDINLPRKQGGGVLQYMRRTRRCGNALVIVVSSSDSAVGRKQMKDLGANGYFHKRSTYAEFMKLGEMVKELLNR
jgi:CheY-like chemotaxis protein